MHKGPFQGLTGTCMRSQMGTHSWERGIGILFGTMDSHIRIPKVTSFGPTKMDVQLV